MTTETFVIDSAEKVVEGLTRAYAARDHGQFARLLARDAAGNAWFKFVLSEPTKDGVREWGYDAERRVHRRMFDPRNTPAGELPVPEVLWLHAVDITLSRQSQWLEQPDFYSDDGGADGRLDRDVYRAVGARFATDVFFATQGEIDYQVGGESYFVVLEDLTKSPGEADKFTLLLWEDLGAPAGKPAAVEEETWSALKSIYL